MLHGREIMGLIEQRPLLYFFQYNLSEDGITPIKVAVVLAYLSRTITTSLFLS